MLNLYFYLYLITLHFIGDWLLQSHWMAINKSKDNVALLYHTGVYSATLLLGLVAAKLLLPSLMLFSAFQLLKFVGVNFVLHTVTDYFTSRCTSALWAKQDWHNFFAAIGADQLIHYLTLAITFVLILAS